MGQCYSICVVEVQERDRNRAHYTPMHRSKKNRTHAPIQIVDSENGFYLYVNERNTLVDGAPDPPKVRRCSTSITTTQRT